MKKLVVFIAIALTSVSLKTFAQVEVKPLSGQQAMLQSSDPRLAQNKKLLYDLWREVFEGGLGRTEEAAFDWGLYLEHTPDAADADSLQRRILAARSQRH